jgi:hypothetical protein
MGRVFRAGARKTPGIQRDQSSFSGSRTVEAETLRICGKSPVPVKEKAAPDALPSTKWAYDQ